MKQTYMQTGKVPTTEAVVDRFFGIGQEEIAEGIFEFVSTIDIRTNGG